MQNSGPTEMLRSLNGTAASFVRGLGEILRGGGGGGGGGGANTVQEVRGGGGPRSYPRFSNRAHLRQFTYWLAFERDHSITPPQ